MEVAAAVVSFVGLAGPVTQSLKFLYEFTLDVKSCPKDLQDIKTDLQLVESLIGLVVQRYESDWRRHHPPEDQVLARAISQAKESVRDLGEALNACGMNAARPTLLRRYQFVFRGAHTQRLIASLHRTKTLMIDIQGLVESHVTTDTNNVVHSSQETIHNVESKVQYSNDRLDYLANCQPEVLSSLKTITEQLGRLELPPVQRSDTNLSMQSFPSTPRRESSSSLSTQSFPSTLRRESSSNFSQASTATNASAVSSRSSIGSSSGKSAYGAPSKATMTWGQTSKSLQGCPESRFKHDTFQFLVACIFLQGVTTDKQRHVACQEAARCLEIYSSPEALSKADETALQPYFEKIGLKNKKPPLVIAFAKAFVANPPVAGQLRAKPKQANFLKSEISHLPQIGPVTLSKWNSFCRDPFYRAAGLEPPSNG